MMFLIAFRKFHCNATNVRPTNALLKRVVGKVLWAQKMRSESRDFSIMTSDCLQGKECGGSCNTRKR